MDADFSTPCYRIYAGQIYFEGNCEKPEFSEAFATKEYYQKRFAEMASEDIDDQVDLIDDISGDLAKARKLGKQGELETQIVQNAVVQAVWALQRLRQENFLHPAYRFQSELGWCEAASWCPSDKPERVQLEEAIDAELAEIQEDHADWLIFPEHCAQFGYDRDAELAYPPATAVQFGGENFACVTVPKSFLDSPGSYTRTAWQEMSAYSAESHFSLFQNPFHEDALYILTAPKDYEGFAKSALARQERIQKDANR